MHAPAKISLSPAQSAARDSLIRYLQISPVLALGGDTGVGKTTVLKELHAELGGAFLDISNILEASKAFHPLALEDAFHQVVLDTLRHHAVVIVDDFQMLQDTFCGHHFYPRGRWLEAPALALCNYALRLDKKLIVSYGGMLPGSLSERSFKTTIHRFKLPDYQVLVSNWLGKTAARPINLAKVFRFAPKLNAHQLRSACAWIDSDSGGITTEAFIEYLRSQRLASNVDLEEVQQVDLKDLIGVDDVLRSLETHIALPLENDQLANELSLRPKRGVLLYGPPGTGKTTVGRALAHRLKGKFFLIDGTFIAGSGDFYARVHQVFEAAKENAPAVIFIDDADAIFEGGEEQGLYRYLLTMLDGLESESAGRICVMMTAMDVNHLPLALIRSGRVELWLEMKMPDEAARRTILQRHLDSVRSFFSTPELTKALSVTEGFTGADLKRVVEDAKGLFAFDRASGNGMRQTEEYLLQAIDAVKVNKQRYSAAESGARMKVRMPSNQGWGFHFVQTSTQIE